MPERKHAMVKTKYNAASEVKRGDIVYIAWYIDDGIGGRTLIAPKLVVHDIDELGDVTVRDALTPDKSWWLNGEWTPSWYALYATRDDAIAAVKPTTLVELHGAV